MQYRLLSLSVLAGCLSTGGASCAHAPVSQEALSARPLAVPESNAAPGKPPAAAPHAQPAAKRCLPSPASQSSVLDAAAAARAWTHRGERRELERAIRAWESQLAAHAQEPSTLTRLARAYGLLARMEVTDEVSSGPCPAHSARLCARQDPRLDALARGVQAGEAALLAGSPALAARVTAGVALEDALDALPKERLASLYWYAADLAELALARGLAATLRLQHRIERSLQYVAEHDESLDDAGAHRALGRYYAKAPPFAGGDLTRSRTEFERALALSPGSLATKLAFARDYAIAAADRELCERLLREVAGTDPTRPLTPEDQLAIGHARKLLEQLDRLL
jgi:hypothetical protein